MKCVLSVCVCVSLCVCVSMYKITQKFVDGFGSKIFLMDRL